MVANSLDFCVLKQVFPFNGLSDCPTVSGFPIVAGWLVENLGIIVLIGGALAKTRRVGNKNS